MKTRLLIIIGILLSLGFIVTAIAEESSFCNVGTHVIFNHTITHGKLNSMCLDRNETVIVKIDTMQEGVLTIDVPRKAVNPIVSCEKDDDFFIIIDGREVNYIETKSTAKSRQLSISFTSDSQEIEIIDIIVGSPPNCAYLYEYDRINVTPLQQIKLGISSQNIICEMGLELIQKYDGHPACVKPETRTKLIERGWAESQLEKYSLTLKEEQSWGYIKNISILENNYISVTMSYPTNEASHELYPDEYRSIVGDCIQQNDSASLSLLYLKEVDSKQNQITFETENKNFEGLHCDDAFWQEMIRHGYCGPPGPLIFRTDNLASSIADAQQQVDFVLDVPKYLPDGYTIQKITVESNGKSVMLYASQKSVTNEMDGCKFSWNDQGILLIYSQPSKDLGSDTAYLNVTDPRKQKVTINGNIGYAVDHWVGDRFGMPIPQQSMVIFYMSEDNKIVQIRSSLASDELIKIAESLPMQEAQTINE